MPYTGAVGSQSQRTVPCSRAPQPWQGGALTVSSTPAVSFTNLFLSGESGNRTATLTAEPRPPIGLMSQRIQITAMGKPQT